MGLCWTVQGAPLLLRNDRRNLLHTREDGFNAEEEWKQGTYVQQLIDFEEKNVSVTPIILILTYLVICAGALREWVVGVRTSLWFSLRLGSVR